MKTILILACVAACSLSACCFGPRPGVYVREEVPPLPETVELDSSQYYYHNGYYYYYQDDSWQYSRDKDGPRAALPRTHWPKDVRHKGKPQAQRKDDEQERGHDQGRGHEEGRGEDNGPGRDGHDQR